MKIPYKDYTELIEKFVESHAIKAMKRSAIKIGGAIKESIYNLDIFLNLICDENVSDKLKEAALDSFALLLEKEQNLKEEYINIAGANINSKTKVDRNMQLLKKLDFATFLTNLPRTTRDEKKFEDFMLKNNILPIVFQSCQEFHSKVKARLQTSPPELKKLLMTQYLFEKSGLPFGKLASLYLEFLQDCFTSSEKLKMETPDLDMIWRSYFLEKFNDDHCNLLWEVLMKEKKDLYFSGKSYGFFRARQLLQGFFENFFCNGAKFIPSKVSIIGIQCFMKYFTLVNENKPKQRKPENFVGINMLWTIPFELENQTIRSQAINMLVDIYIKNIMDEILEKKDIVEKFMHRVLIRASQDTKSIKVAMEILNQYTLK